MKVFKSWFSFYLLLLIVLFFAGCTSEQVTDVVEDKEDTEEPGDDEDPTTVMVLSTILLDYEFTKESLSIYIKNKGNTDFDWNWDKNSHNLLALEPDSGSLKAGDSIAVRMTLDRTNLITQKDTLETFITNSADQEETLYIQFGNFVEQKQLITGTVIDAEYDRNNDVLVVVSENPNELRIFDMTDQSVQSISLNLPPTCVSIGMNGTHAAVGHNGWFSYVNLATSELEKTYAVTTNAYDIILAPNDWVYVLPKEDQWVRMRCINLSNGTETEHTGNFIRERTNVKLHPSGDYIYGATNGSSPSDFEKYDITGGTADFLYDSPYHGDYPFDGNIWISEDGKRLFAKSRRVFNASLNEANDMTYNGELVGDGNVITLDYSSAAKKVYTVFTTGDFEGKPTNEIRKYETDYLAFKGTVELPGFFIPNGNDGGEIYKSLGYFGFFNSSGTKYHVLVKAEEGSGAQNEWAIATIDVE